MSRPAHAITAVETARIAGISRSIVSRWNGTYINTIRPRPTASVTCHRRFSFRRSSWSSAVVVRACGSVRSRCGLAVYPARVTACSRSSRSSRAGSKVTDATSVARLTCASATPSSFRSARSTRPTQDAQVMPPIWSVQPVVDAIVEVAVIFRSFPFGCGVSWSGDEGVAGLIGGGGDVGPVDRPVGVHGDRTGGQIDIDPLDAGHQADLLLDGPPAVLTRHSGDPEDGARHEGVGGVAHHGVLLSDGGSGGRRRAFRRGRRSR